MAWRLAKSLETLRSQINAAYPSRSKVSDGTIGDAAHSSRASDHNPNAAGVVCAFDVTHDLDKKGDDFDAWTFAETLRLNQDSRIGYVISNGRIFSGPAGPQPFVWRKYTGSNKHALHTHISVRQAAGFYDDVAPWKTHMPSGGAITPPPVVAPPPGITESLRQQMAKTIIDYEARRDTAGNLMIHRPADGSYEVAGLNSAHHPVEAAVIRKLVEAKNYPAAERYAADFILKYTKAATGWATDAGCEFMLRDCVYNRGSSGGAKILQYALGFDGADVDGQIGQKSRARLEQEKPLVLIEKLRIAREKYERKVLNRNESDSRWIGLVNRWNNSQRDAKGFYEKGRGAVGGNGAKGGTTGAIVVATVETARQVAQKPAEQGGGFDWWLLIPILVVGASLALVTWFVWPRKEGETAA